MGRRELLGGVADGAPVVRLALPDQLHEALPVQALRREGEKSTAKQDKTGKYIGKKFFMKKED